MPLARPASPDAGSSTLAVRLPPLSWNVANVAALIGAGFIAVGCFLPWGVFGFVTVSGIQASGGWLFLLGAAIIAVAVSISLRGIVGIGIGISFLVFGLAVGVGVASEGSHPDSIVSNANQGAGFAVATAGAGLGVVALGALIVGFAGVYDLIRSWAER